MNTFKFVGLTCLFYLLTLLPEFAAADAVFIKATPKGDYYFKMSSLTGTKSPVSGVSSSGHSDIEMAGTAYRVLAADQDEILWRTTGWFSNNVFLSSDGTRLVRVEEDMMYLYENGQQRATRSAGSTSLGGKIQVDNRRSGFSQDQKNFLLVTSSGKSEIFSLLVGKTGEPQAIGFRTIAKRVESTVSYDRAVRNYAEVQVKVEGESRNSRSTVANSVAGKQSASTFIGVKTRNSSGPEKAEGLRSSGPAPVVRKPTSSLNVQGKYECRVEAKLYASATRKKVTSTRQIYQSGASEEMAADRAMAYCEGVVGAGSRTPRGRCELHECTNLNAGTVPKE